MAVDLVGQTALVVGATGGIGMATACAFAVAGATVTSGGRATILDSNGIEAFFAGAEAFDHVVVAAAKTGRRPVGELPLADASAAMESMFWRAYRIARAAKVNDGGVHDLD